MFDLVGLLGEPVVDAVDDGDGDVREDAETESDSLGMVEIVDPVENPTFCANCHRVRVTHDGKLKGCLNRHDDLRSMGEMTREEIRETFRETVANRVPYYGEYMVRDDDGEWVLNEKYVDPPRATE